MTGPDEHEGIGLALSAGPAGREPFGEEPQPRRKRRVWLPLAIVGIVVALIAALVLPRIFGSGDDDLGGWDPRVADLVRYVERERGLTFDHPVPIDFLTQDAFEDELTASEDDLTERDERELAAYEATFAVLGLIPQDIDLLDEINTLSAEGTLAFYDSERERVFLPEGSMTPMLRATLVHELVHALQDQRFGLDDLADEDMPDDEANAFRALVEGDASRIEHAYVATLGPEDAERYQQEWRAGFDEVTDDVQDVPALLQVGFESPYVLGEAFATAVAIDGNAAVDRAFTERPTSEEHLLDPFTFIDGDDPIDVATPTLGPGETELDRGDFGAMGWYLLLSTALDANTALEAVDGWGGDSYIVAESAKGTCVRAAVQGDDPFETTHLEVALRDWMRGMPDGSTRLDRDGDLLSLASCDTGEVRVRTFPRQALWVPAFRTMLAVQAADVGWPVSVGRCAGLQTIRELDADTLESLAAHGLTQKLTAPITEVVGEQLEYCSGSA